MIASFVIQVPAGAMFASTGLGASGLLSGISHDRMPYLAEIRVVMPESHPVWRIDGTRMGGQVAGTWWSWASSSTSTRILPPNAVGTADWQLIHGFPGIPLADGGDACGSSWINNTVLRFTSSLPAVAAYEVTVIANIVQHTELIT